MAEIVNLNKARKAKARTDGAAKASENRIKFGRTKAEKDLQRQRDGLAARQLEAHRRSGETE